MKGEVEEEDQACMLVCGFGKEAAEGKSTPTPNKAVNTKGKMKTKSKTRK